jgi:hypothetical protein
LVTAYGKAQELKPEKLAALIECYVGEDFGKDTLRRFLDRLAGDQRSYAQMTSRPETLEKLASFLAHPKIGLLNLDHLQFRNFPTTAPIAFINTLLFDLDDALPRLHPSYGGTYKVAASDQSHTTEPELSISIEKEKDWFVVRMRTYENDANSGDWIARSHEGWGVLPPENNLFIHIKHARSGRNTLLSTPASPLDFAAPRAEATALILQDSSDPVEAMDWTAISEMVTDKNNLDNILYFNGIMRISLAKTRNLI